MKFAGGFEPTLLPDSEKKELCESLLREFGVTQWRATDRGELIHSCPLPNTRHRNGDRNPSASVNYRKLTFNCVQADTLVKTYDGEFPISDLAGRTVRLLDGRGCWVDAPVKCYGEDRIYRVTLTRNGVKRVVETTLDHRWYVRQKGAYQRGKTHDLVEKTTGTLKPKDRIPSVWAMTRTGRTTISPTGVMAGFVYGDGSQNKHGSVANFIGGKDMALMPYFAAHEIKFYGEDKYRVLTGLPRSWKILPSLEEGASYLWGWLAGYFAADGCVAADGHVTMSCATEATLKFVAALCDRLGVATYTLSGRTREGIDGCPSDIYSLSFRGSTLTPEFFLLHHHRSRFEEGRQTRRYERTHWWVSSVEDTGRTEPVYCAEVSTTHSFVLAGNVLTGNCLGCGSKGGLLWWIASCRGEGSEEARAWLEGATGTGQTVMDLPRLLELLDALASPASPRTPIPRYDQSVLAPWTGWPIHHPYLTDQPPDGRGCPSSTLQFFSVGYSDQYFDGTERIIIPLFWCGDLVGWQARQIAPWDEPKYKNSPDFPRDRLIYNSHDLPTAVVVESPLSVLRHHHHCPNLVATFGAEVAASQMQWLQRYERIVLWYDNDPAGWEATKRVGTALEPYNPVWVVQSPYDADPADLDDGAVEQLIEDAVPLSIWQQPQELQRWNGDQRGHS